MSEKKTLVYAILQFLEEEKSTAQEEIAESLEVAQQCLETAYNVSSSDPPEQYQLPDSLQVVFANGLKSTPCAQIPTDVASSSKVVPKENKMKGEEFKSKGNDCMKEEKYEEAIQFYNQAIDQDMTNAVYFCNRAAAYSKLDKHEDALRDCGTAIAIDPTYSKAFGRKGLAHSALNQHPEAKTCYEKAIELDPNNTSYKQNLDVTNQKLAEAGMSAGANAAGLNLGGMDFSAMLSNPALMNMATNMMSNPQIQTMMANLMSGGEAQQGGPEGLGGLLHAGQQLAQQMQQSNPELVDQLRSQMRQNPSNSQPDGNDTS